MRETTDYFCGSAEISYTDPAILLTPPIRDGASRMVCGLAVQLKKSNVSYAWILEGQDMHQ
jgi:hypothetical protein